MPMLSGHLQALARSTMLIQEHRSTVPGDAVAATALTWQETPRSPRAVVASTTVTALAARYTDLVMPCREWSPTVQAGPSAVLERRRGGRQSHEAMKPGSRESLSSQELSMPMPRAEVARLGGIAASSNRTPQQRKDLARRAQRSAAAKTVASAAGLNDDEQARLIKVLADAAPPWPEDTKARIRAIFAPVLQDIIRDGERS
jgi:hypothetical protein